MDASADPIGTVFTRRDHPGGITTVCRQCGHPTSIDFGTVTSSCAHIAVRFCDEGSDR